MYSRVKFEKLCEAAGSEVLFCIIMEGVIFEKFLEAPGTEVLLFFAGSCSVESMENSFQSESHIYF